MTQTKTALKLALEALVRADRISGYPNNKKVITAIREALAQPEQWPENVQYTGNGTAGREADVKPTGFFFQMPPHRKPLTDEEICPWFQENTALTNEAAMRITRAIEAAHGIKGEA